MCNKNYIFSNEMEFLACYLLCSILKYEYDKVSILSKATLCILRYRYAAMLPLVLRTDSVATPFYMEINYLIL